MFPHIFDSNSSRVFASHISSSIVPALGSISTTGSVADPRQLQIDSSKFLLKSGKEIGLLLKRSFVGLWLEIFADAFLVSNLSCIVVILDDVSLFVFSAKQSPFSVIFSHCASIASFNALINTRKADVCTVLIKIIFS